MIRRPVKVMKPGAESLRLVINHQTERTDPRLGLGSGDPGHAKLDLLRLGLPALTVLFGLQTLRVFVPALLYTYGALPGVGPVDMGLYAFGTFSVAFLAAALRRLLRPRAALAITAGGVALLRLAIQLSPSPWLNLALATAGTSSFLLFLVVYLGHVRQAGADGQYAPALLLGLALDTGLHGVLGTYDLSWRPGPGPALLVLALVLVQLALLVRALREGEARRPSDAGFLASLPFLALGPFLFLQALLLQNVATVTVLLGWPQPMSFTVVMLANVAAIAMAAWIVSRARRSWWPAAGLFGVLLILALRMVQLGGWEGAVGLLLTQASTAGELALILTALESRADRPGFWRTTLAGGLGSVLFMALLFAYYIVYDRSMPYSNTLLLPLAGAILLPCALGAASSLPAGRAAVRFDWTPVWTALALLLLPLISWATWHIPQPIAGQGGSVRIMTYNLHQGFDGEGRPAMEAQARVIEESGADIVALQEVSRGWYINGSSDMLVWLSRRLGMPCIFGPTADPLWGSAILSRYPVREHGHALLPPADLPLRRGYMWAEIDLGDGEELLVIATHLHHIEADHETHLVQLAPILDFWGGRERTVILGDMNSWPHSPEIAMLRRAGLRDAFAEVGSGDGYTFSSIKPYERIDYIWVPPDLPVGDLVIPHSRASDHFGVVATVGR